MRRSQQARDLRISNTVQIANKAVVQSYSINTSQLLCELALPIHSTH